MLDPALRALPEGLLYSDINFDKGVRVIFSQNETDKEVSFHDFFWLPGVSGCFNDTDYKLMQIALILHGKYHFQDPYGKYRGEKSIAFSIQIVPGTLSYTHTPWPEQ